MLDTGMEARALGRRGRSESDARVLGLLSKATVGLTVNDVTNRCGWSTSQTSCALVALEAEGVAHVMTAFSALDHAALATVEPEGRPEASAHNPPPAGLPSGRGITAEAPRPGRELATVEKP